VTLPKGKEGLAVGDEERYASRCCNDTGEAGVKALLFFCLLKPNSFANIDLLLLLLVIV